jgi:hypothetical protein
MGGGGVVVGGVLAGLLGVMLGVGVVAMRDVGMVAGFLVISRCMMLGSEAMMFRGVLVVLGGFQVVILSFFRHGAFGHGALFLRYGSRF